jgi:MoaA/NifB/PqqE/SkfB family radical SAM enzyme
MSMAGPTGRVLGMRSTTPARPVNVIWDLTYACPLRCVHCYSESGRRPGRQLDRDAMLRVADAIIGLRPDGVALAGGEPLVVREVFDVAGRFAEAGVPVVLYTGGGPLTEVLLEPAAATLAQIVVSVDGASPPVHDRIRGRAGSFDAAMDALGRLDRAAADARDAGRRALPFAVDYAVVRSNLGEVDAMCRDVAARFPALAVLTFGPAVPAGLASRPGFVEHELLTDAEVDELAAPARQAALRELAPPSVQVSVTDNRILQMHPDRVARGEVFPAMTVEPDGAVRAMPIYEGTVGNLLTDEPLELWRRSVARWSDPFVVGALRPARTFAAWADAARRIDRRFGSPQVIARIDRRPEFIGAGAAGER